MRDEAIAEHRPEKNRRDEGRRICQEHGRAEPEALLRQPQIHQPSALLRHEDLGGLVSHRNAFVNRLAGERLELGAQTIMVPPTDSERTFRSLRDPASS